MSDTSSARSSEMSSISAFSRDDAPLRDFLRVQGAGTEEARFPARNFLLDEGVIADRADTYHRVAGVGFSDGDAWSAGHKEYLRHSVALDQTRGIPKDLDPKRPDRCPETFRHDSAFRDHGGAFQKLRVVRVVKAAFVARWGGVEVADLLSAGREWTKAQAEERQAADDVVELLDSVLTVWGEQCDLRPVWASFLQDHENLFGATPSADADGWADELRDRLGLSHLHPMPGGNLPILVFRYPVSAVPSRKNFKGKPLAVPTVLDGELSPAFCPAPMEEPVGRLVNLAASGAEPAREIVHPFFVPEAKHLFRIGEINRPVPVDLSEARARHLRTLRERRADYGESTDADLLEANA